MDFWFISTPGKKTGNITQIPDELELKILIERIGDIIIGNQKYRFSI